MSASPRFPRVILFDWGDTLMSEDGPQDYTMADWPVVHAIDDAALVLRTLSPHFRIGIASNATISRHADIQRALTRVGLAEFIGDIFCFTEIGQRKDDPAFWRVVLDRLNVQASEILMIGDSLEQDVLGPARAGVRTIWFNWKNEPAPQHTTVATIYRLRELLPLLLGAAPTSAS